MFKKKKFENEHIPVGSIRIVPCCENEYSAKLWKVQIKKPYDAPYDANTKEIWRDWETAKTKNMKFQTPQEALKAYSDWYSLVSKMIEHLNQPTIMYGPSQFNEERKKSTRF